MARDTRGPVPGATDDMTRASLTVSHWAGARRMLAAQFACLMVLSGAILVVVWSAARRSDGGVKLIGVEVSATLGWILLGLAVAAGIAVIWRRAALVVTAALSLGSVSLVVVSAVGAVHHAHPFGASVAVLLLWAIIFCFNFGVAVWLVPDHIEGPAWVKRTSGR